MTIKALDVAAIDRASLFHPFTSVADHMRDGPLVISEGAGVRIKDVHGREYLDGMAGLWCVNLGYGRQEITDAMAAQSRKLSYFHAFNSMSTDIAAECAEALLKRAPGKMARVFFGTSGSDANETQIKLIWYYNNLLGRPKKKKIISRWFGYHGSSVVSTGLTGLASMHALFDLPLGPILHTTRPHYYREAPPGMTERAFSRKLAADLEQLIEREGADTIAAFFAEPVMGAGGLIPPPEGYFEEIVPILQRHDVLLVADEVVTGFGRLGTYWGGETYGLKPDLVTAAKGVTSGYFPMSVCYLSPKIWDVIEAESPKAGLFGHGYTYSAHPVGAAAALATLMLIDAEKVVPHVAELGPYFQHKMRAAVADHPLVGEVRGKGFMIGIELVQNRATKEAFPREALVGRRLVKKLLNLGLIGRALGDTVVFAPPLVISQGDLDQLISIFKSGLDAIGREIV
jgi:L-2,4-diaminobutyrate transaminase